MKNKENITLFVISFCIICAFLLIKLQFYHTWKTIRRVDKLEASLKKLSKEIEEDYTETGTVIIKNYEYIKQHKKRIHYGGVKK